MWPGRDFLAAATAWFWLNVNPVRLHTAHRPMRRKKQSQNCVTVGLAEQSIWSGAAHSLLWVSARYRNWPPCKSRGVWPRSLASPRPRHGLASAFYAFSRIFILIRRPSGNIHLPASVCNRPSFRAFRAFRLGHATRVHCRLFFVQEEDLRFRLRS
jgi:hypothetical protein